MVKVDDVAGDVDGLGGVDFSNSEEVKAWTLKRTFEERNLMATRAALRSFPNTMDVTLDDFSVYMLHIFWGLIIAFVRASGREEGMDAERAGGHARSSANIPEQQKKVRGMNAAYSTQYSVKATIPETSAGYTQRAVMMAAMSIGRSGKKAFAIDDHLIRNGLLLGPVWNDVLIPDHEQRNHEKLLELLSRDQRWRFFEEWYLGVWEGTWTDWDLAHDVAKIEAEVWTGEDALARVAAEIEKINAKIIAGRLPQVDEVFENEEGLYDVRSAFVEPAILIDSIVKRVAFAFGTATMSNSCDLNDMSLAAKILRTALDEFQDDPNAMEQMFREAVDIIENKIKDGQFAEDDELSFLTRTLNETALQLRADHPDVATAADARLQRRLREIDQEKTLAIAQSIDEMQEGTTKRFGAQFALAAETAKATNAPEAQASAIKRSGNHAARIGLAEKAKKAEGSGAMSALKIGLRADKVVEWVTWLISGGG